MCTVTFIPKQNNHFIFTSNRDEAPDRITIPPKFYTENGVKLLYPKDKKAGGTWIGVSEKHRLVCLLNGGFSAHKPEENYRMSRGIVVRDILIASLYIKTIEDYNFKGIEPFTMIILDWENGLELHQLVWDGTVKHLEKLPNEPKIWSSSSLYTDPMKHLRVIWFNEFKNQNNFQLEAINQFHKTAGSQHPDMGLIMDRGFVKTTSITQIEKMDLKVTLKYTDLQNNQTSHNEMYFNNQ